MVEMEKRVAIRMAMVVDDEVLARERILRMLRESYTIETVLEADSVGRATALLRHASPDVVFLDVQLRDGTGFDVIESIGLDHFPPVVFVTAYDEHAVKAFEVCAADYLLKPCTTKRLVAAVDRALARQHEETDSSEMLSRVMQSTRSARPWQDRFLVKRNDSYEVVLASNIDYIEAANNYVRLNVARNSYLIRGTLRDVEMTVDPARFVRIHRSVVVNIDRVRQLKPSFSGDYIIVLDTGKELRMSRTYRENLQSYMRLGFRDD